MQVSRAIGNKGNLQQEWGSTLYHLDDLNFFGSDMQDLPDAFTPAKSKVSLHKTPYMLLFFCRRHEDELQAGELQTFEQNEADQC